MASVTAMDAEAAAADVQHMADGYIYSSNQGYICAKQFLLK